jgi:uncharacterized Zn finger protein
VAEEYWGYRPYVSVGERRARGQRELRRRLRDEQRAAAPVVCRARTIARTFWGRAWCENLERYSDFATRLPRGRTYLRNGSILDLQILPGRVRAHVAGTDLYTVEVAIRRLAAGRWREVVRACAGKIGSAIALLRGELSDDVMAVLTHRTRGLFPEPGEIRMQCSCPDWATMCKHVAATLYGVGVRLDERPELFFTLRQVAQADLVGGAGAANLLGPSDRGDAGRKRIAADRLEAIFGIALAADGPARQRATSSRRRGRARERRRS